MRVYRHRADRLPSVIVLLVLTVQLSAFFLIDSLWLLAAVALALLFFSAVPGSISHNHHHTPTFMRPWMNRIYEVVLFLETGVLPWAWTLHHNLGHHKHYLDQEKDPSPWKHADGRVMSRVYYDVIGALRIYPEVFAIGRRHPELLRRFKLWAVVSLTVLGVLLAIDPAKALILFVAPMPLMYLGLLDNTYMQHSDLDTASEFTASRNTTSRFYNLVSWNLGYHTAHHMKPNLHWSELPRLHEELRARIPAGMQCESVLLGDCRYRHSRDGIPPRNVLPVDAIQEIVDILPVPPVPVRRLPAVRRWRPRPAYTA
ncbi:MAG: fatty acid desaturase [Pseudomonadota bacterium]